MIANGLIERKVSIVMQSFTPEQGLFILGVRQPERNRESTWDGEISSQPSKVPLASDGWHELARLLQGVLNGLGEKDEEGEQADES